MEFGRRLSRAVENTATTGGGVHFVVFMVCGLSVVSLIKLSFFGPFASAKDKHVLGPIQFSQQWCQFCLAAPSFIKLARRAKAHEERARELRLYAAHLKVRDGRNPGR